MSSRKNFIFLVIFMASSSMSWAQRWDSTYSIGGFGGVNIPMTPSAFQSYTKITPGFGVELKYNVTDMLSFSVAINYFTFKRNVNQIEEDYIDDNPGSIVVDIDGGKKTFDFFNVNFSRYLTPHHSRQSVYLIGGMCNFRIEDETFLLSAISPSNEIRAKARQEHYFGLQGGIGFELAFDGNILVFLEGLYRRILTNNAEAPWGEELGKRKDHLSFISILFGMRFMMD